MSNHRPDSNQDFIARICLDSCVLTLFPSRVTVMKWFVDTHVLACRRQRSYMLHLERPNSITALYRPLYRVSIGHMHL
jgi:hypothetical protein